MTTMQVFMILFMIIFIESNSQESPVTKCAENGFDESLLKCSTCNLLKQVPDGEAIVKECLSCCTSDDVVDQPLYTSASFVYCSCRFRSNPELATFVQSIPKKFPSVKIRDVRGFSMFIEVTTNTGEVEKIPAESWSVDDISTFLSEKVAPNTSLEERDL
uniref:Selenoprotein F n=1 Tax=Spongospora subterranea TaxID=70186 RepID=A0A0H5RDC1_9EUKA|eukprot:CRZ11587.1 hypothetical protein [Spongospora subterranea]